MKNQPNILWILTDQHSPHVCGFNGNPLVDTPNLDRLADRSTVFDAAYCQAPLCVPSRTSMLVGKYPQHCSAYDNSWPIFPEHTTIPGWFAQHGYRTASVGKMHFRGKEQMHGWQERPYGDLVESNILLHQPDPPDTADGRANLHSVGRFPFAGASQIPESLQQDRVVTIESLAWLKEFAARGEEMPWLFCASYYRPHFPLTAPDRYFQKYLAKAELQPTLPPQDWQHFHPHDRFIIEDFHLDEMDYELHRKALAAYYASVEYTDACIGELLNGLEAEGLLENTIIVYTADHGELAGEHGLWWKRSYYEASARVPLIVDLPDAAGEHRIAEPVELVDLFPSFCDWAGIPMPEGLDGESLTSLLAARPVERKKKIAYSALLGEKEENRFRMLYDGCWKLVDFPTSETRLFNLQTDPDEMQDCWGEAPIEDAVDQLVQQINDLPGWGEIEAMRVSDQKRCEPIRLVKKGAVQYRLPDGRIIAGDDHLYEG